MSKKIIGVTVGTTISPTRMEKKIKPVKTVNGKAPDDNGNVEVVGNNGADGISPVVSVASITGGHRITITDKNGTKTVDVMNGSNGKDGRGIKSVARTSGSGAAGTTDTYTITYSDNTTSAFTVYNGKNGKSAYAYAQEGGYAGTEAEFGKMLASSNSLQSWADVQKAVKAGKAPALYPVGTQFLVNHKVYKLLVFTVVAHNHFKSASNTSAPTMTLLCQSQFLSMSFGHQEALYHADEAIPAGTYNFKLSSKLGSWEAGSYYFTLTQALPKGGQLAINGDSSTALTELTISSYSSNTSAEAIETVAIKSGASGTKLGTLGSTSSSTLTLNHIRRVAQGSNNYKESDIRIFLNSTAPSNIWTPQTKFKRPPTWADRLAGFAAGFDDDLLSCIGEVAVDCKANDIWESPDSTISAGSKYTVNDKFFLLSEREIFGTHVTGAVDQSSLLGYYNGASNVDRIEYWEMQASYWWTRTPLADYPGSAVMVHPTGESVSSSAMNPRMCIPAFTIV